MATAFDDLLTDAPPSGGLDDLLTDKAPIHLDDLLSDEPPKQGPAPEGALGSFFRPIASNIFPSLATAGGGAAGATLGGLAGIETGPGAIATGIAGDIAGGTAAGAAAQALQEKLLGEQTIKEMQAQEAANMAEHPFWAKMGTMIGQLPSVLGGGARFAKSAAEQIPGLAERVATAGVQGARMGGSEAAQQEVQGNQDISIPEEIIKGAINFGPTGLLGPAKTLLGAVGVKAPTDAALMATSTALYDKVVHGKPIDPAALSQQVGADIPGFMLLNALGHGIPALAGKKAPSETPEGQITPPEPAIPPEAKVVVPLATDTAAKLRELDPKSRSFCSMACVTMRGTDPTFPPTSGGISTSGVGGATGDS